MKNDLTSNLIFFRPVTKVKYINNYIAIFDFIHTGLFLICQGMCRILGFEQYDSLIEELLVLNTWAISCWLLFFVGIEKNGLTAHSRIATKIGNR